MSGGFLCAPRGEAADDPTAENSAALQTVNTMPKYSTLVLALGLKPAYWSRFTFIAKQTWWDERASRAGSIRRLVWGRPALPFKTTAISAAFDEVTKIIDAQPVPMDNREIR